MFHIYSSIFFSKFSSLEQLTVTTSFSMYRICTMNDHSYPYLSSSTKYFSSIDIYFCHPSLFLYYNWSVCKDQYNSDHVPLIIEQNTVSTENQNPKCKN